MIGYVTIGTNDPDKALAYYDALLAEVGAKRMMEMPEDGFTMYGTSWDQPSLAVTRPYNGEPATVGNGNMAGLMVESRDKVHRVHARALELGGSDEGQPGLRGPEEMGFYAGYFRDPEGNKFSVFNVAMPS